MPASPCHPQRPKSYNFNSWQRLIHERKRPKTPINASAPVRNTQGVAPLAVRRVARYIDSIPIYFTA